MGQEPVVDALVPPTERSAQQPVGEGKPYAGHDHREEQDSRERDPHGHRRGVMVVEAFAECACHTVRSHDKRFLLLAERQTSGDDRACAEGRPVGMAACVTVVVVLGIAVSGHRPIGLDLPIATWVADRGGDGAVFRVLTHLGASLTVSVLGIAVRLSMFVRRRTPWPLLFVLVTIAGEILLNNAVKGLVDRPRPTLSQIVTPVGSSFPSGHSAAAAAAYAAIAIVLARDRSPSVRWGMAVGAVTIAMVVAWSRGCSWASTGTQM